MPSTNSENLTHERISGSEVLLRPFQQEDLSAVVALTQRNFNGHSYEQMPTDVVAAYKAANTLEALAEATQAEGTESYVATNERGEIAGFMLLRHYGSSISRADLRRSYGQLDIRRIHVDANQQGLGVGRKLLELAEARARELHVDAISTHASGSSRSFFEQNGWEGETVLNSMKPIPALVFAAHKRITPEVTATRYKGVREIIYAGTNETKQSFIHSILPELPVSGVTADESDTPYVVEAARSKVYDALHHYPYDKRNIVFVGVDVRTDLLAMVDDEHHYELANRGKPKTIEEAQANFALLLQTAKETGKPAPYIVKSATYLHNPHTQVDTWNTRDITVTLSEEALSILSTREGLDQYRQGVLEQYGVDILEMAAGFALPYFLQQGWVANINGYSSQDLADSQIAQQAINLVLGSADENLLRRAIEIPPVEQVTIKPVSLEGYYYSTPQQATWAALSRIHYAAKIGARGIFLNDIDDVAAYSEEALRLALDEYFKSFDPNFPPTSLDEVLAAGGRYWQLQKYQDAAAKLGLSFGDIYTQVAATNAETHASMDVNDDALIFQGQMLQNGFLLGAYPTARPHEIATTTAEWLEQHEFQRAPVVDVSADSADPAEAKVNYVVNVLLPNIPRSLWGHIYLIDDHVKTAIVLAQQSNGAVIPLVPEVPRNANDIHLLDEYGIAHGTFNELVKVASDR